MYLLTLESVVILQAVPWLRTSFHSDRVVEVKSRIKRAVICKRCAKVFCLVEHDVKTPVIVNAVELVRPKIKLMLFSFS